MATKFYPGVETFAECRLEHSSKSRTPAFQKHFAARPKSFAYVCLIGNGIPSGKLDKKWQINFSPAYLFNFRQLLLSEMSEIYASAH